ncbi:MAG: hypothetical protein Q9217_006893, partial [Psora testacea]
DLFTAKSAYDCLLSAPFNDTIALEFLQYYKDTLQLQSTQAYLKTPPSSYQQPSFDLLAGLDEISDRVKANYFKNEYEFEYALQQWVIATHDAHIQLIFGILSVFTFGSPYGLVSVSNDGISLPEVFILDDLIEAQVEEVAWSPSPVQFINDQKTTDFLDAFAASNVQGGIEPHTDWNHLMSSAASDIQGLFSTFEGSSLFYPGENIMFKFANGSQTDELPWLAQFSQFGDPAASPIILTGQQLYDWYVVGIDSTDVDSTTVDLSATSSLPQAVPTPSGSLPPDTSADSNEFPSPSISIATFTASSGAGTQPTPEATVTSWDNSAYPPDPIAAQPDLADVNGGFLTGYILNDNITAVLSIPSFAMNSEDAASFSSTVEDFIHRSKAAGCSRLIIDLQRNQGGSDLLATDTFKHFFPDIDPFNGARMRAYTTTDALGNTFTTYYETQAPEQMDPSYEELSASVWVATDYLKADTGRNFTSWAEYFGPHAFNGDLFTTVQRRNLSSTVFDQQVAEIVVYGYANRTATSAQPYPAKDVIILSDAFCSSACARFVEMMRHEAGARTVVAGGRPVTGPMQTVGGNRGAESYSSLDLDLDIDTAVQFNASVAQQLPQGRDDVGFAVTYAGFNIKDAMRKHEDTPLQFQYEAADCRIFYTKNTIYNYINLWNYVIDALYRNPALCVAGSTDPNSSGSNINSTTSAAQAKHSSVGGLIMKGLHLKKRTMPGDIIDTTSLETSHNDKPYDLDTCQKCSSGDVCYERPHFQILTMDMGPEDQVGA